jgi:hypothetical protein
MIKSFALSIKQPWACLIAAGYKDIENRTWHTYYRGPFYIHAPKKPDAVVTLAELVALHHLPIDPAKVTLRYGGIIGRARIVGCVKDSRSRWFAGPYGLLIRDAEMIDFIPCRGKLGFFPVEI